MIAHDRVDLVGVDGAGAGPMTLDGHRCCSEWCGTDPVRGGEPRRGALSQNARRR